MKAADGSPFLFVPAAAASSSSSSSKKIRQPKQSILEVSADDTVRSSVLSGPVNK